MGHWGLGIGQTGHWAQEAEVQRSRGAEGKILTATSPLLPHPPVGERSRTTSPLLPTPQSPTPS